MQYIKFGLFGAGGFAREVMPFVKESVQKILSLQESHIQLYFVETWQPKIDKLNEYSFISLEEFAQLRGKKYFNVAVANGKNRAAIVEAVGDYAEPLSLIASQATIFDNNVIESGSIFCPYSMVTSNAKIGKFFHCNIYSYVAHDCVIGDYVTFAPGVRCNGRVQVGDHAYIGTNAVIREGTPEKPLRIGANAVVGMGAVVTRDVPDGATVVGSPARVMTKQ